SRLLYSISFFFLFYGSYRALHSFPTRRSSDLFTVLNCSLTGFCGFATVINLAPYCMVSSVPRFLRLLNNPIYTLLYTFLFTRIADRKSTRLNSSHVSISYAVFCLKKKK